MATRVGTTTAVVDARIDVDAADWSAAVYAAADLLVGVDAAERRYAQRCVGLLKEQGPYIVIAPGLALAHARPQDGALALGLTAVRLRAPVRFGHKENDPVDVVLAFSSPTPGIHVDLLAALARALVAGLAEDLRAARTDADAVKLLQEVVDDVG